MARIKYSALVTSINGSSGGTTFQRNQYGNTMKNKPAMPVPRSVFQNQQKVFMQNATQRWRSLSDSQRLEWVTYATTYPTPTRLNPDAYLNGFNLFVKLNSLLLLGGIAIRESVSLTLELLTPTAIQIFWDGDVFNFNFDASAFSGTWYTFVFISPRIQGYTVARTTKTRFIKRYNATFAAPATEIGTEYNQRFSEALIIGEQYYVDVTWINNLSGQIIEWPTQVITVTDES